MKAIRLEEPRRLALFSADEPGASLKPDEALVRVRRIGVCGTDIHAFNGNQPFFSYPRILGHELGVEVTAVGSSVAKRASRRPMCGGALSELWPLHRLPYRQTQLLR